MPAVSETASPNDILVIVNKSADIDSISMGELAQIFLKEKTSWSNGQRIIPINAREGGDLRKSFRTKALAMRTSEEEIYWENQKIRSQLNPPVEMSNTPKAVFKLKYAISYAFRRDLPDNVVKVILVIPE